MKRALEQLDAYLTCANFVEGDKGERLGKHGTRQVVGSKGERNDHDGKQ